MYAEPDEAVPRASSEGAGDGPSVPFPDRARHAWLAGRVDRDVRGILQGLLLWTERLTEGMEDGGRGSVDECLRKLGSVRRELADSVALVDALVAVGRPEADGDERLWPRVVVARDFLAAAVRAGAPEAAESAVVVETRALPEDLHFVADPDRALQAAVGLLRAGVRSARTGERISLEVETEGEGSTGGPLWTRISLRTPRLSLGPEAEREALCRGLPSRTADLGRRGAALPFAVAGRCARRMDGTLSLERADDGGGATAVLRLPADREPERRPGWIP